MNVVGPQAFVTERNLERAIDPSLVPDGGRTGLDTDYLVKLGDEAVVPVVDAWDRLGQADRDALAPALAWREEQLRTDPSLQGWPAWNLTRERARAALLAWEAAQGTASRQGLPGGQLAPPPPQPAIGSVGAGLRHEPAERPAGDQRDHHAARGSPAATRSRTRSPPETRRLAGADQGRGRAVDVGRRVPALGGLLDLDDLGAERGDERPVGDLVLQLQPLAVELLDLAADLRDPRLDLEQVGDLAGPLGDLDEHLLARAQVPDPCLEVHDLAADLGRLGLLAHDLGREAAQRRRGRPPSAWPGCGR